jgi:hypothetical protein
MTKDIEKMNELFHMIEKSEIGQQIISDKKAATVTERQKICSEIQRIEDGLKADNENHAAALTKINFEVEKLKRQLDDLIGKRQRAINDHIVSGILMGNAQTRLEAELLDSCDHEIIEAIEHFKELQNFFRLPENVDRFAVFDDSDQMFHDPEHRRRKRFDLSNYRRIDGILSYCKGAIQELENMRLTAAIDTAKIDDLLGGTPAAGFLDVDEIKIPKKSIREVLFPRGA